MKIYLHIGTHKTGSTALQEFFFNNRDALLKKGVLYPARGLIDHAHHDVAWRIRDEGPPWLIQYLKLLDEELRGKDAQAVLLSSEEFELLRKKNHISALREHEVHLILFLRRQDDYLESEYNQHVKAPKTRFTEDIYKFSLFHDFSSRFNYRLLCDFWETSIKPASMSVFNYDDIKSKGREEIFNVVMEVIGLNSSKNGCKLPKQTANPSIPSEGTLYVARANALGIPEANHLKLLEAVTQKFPAGGRLLLPRHRMALWRRFANPNKYVSEKYGIPPFAAPTPSPEDQEYVDFESGFNPGIFQKLLEDSGIRRASGTAPDSREDGWPDPWNYLVIGFPDSRRMERFASKNKQIPAFKLIPAVDGRALPDILTQGLFTKSAVDHQRKTRGLQWQSWISGTVGCLLSHIKAIEFALNRGLDYAVIAEDDARFRSDPAPYLALARAGDFDVVYLIEGMRTTNEVTEGELPRIVQSTAAFMRGTGSYGYIISRLGMQTVLDNFQRALKNGLPAGFDALLQSTSVINYGQGTPRAIFDLASLLAFLNRDNKRLETESRHTLGRPGGKSLLDYAAYRRAALKVGIGIPSIVSHDDEGVSFIHGTA